MYTISPHTGLYNTGENIANGFTWDLNSLDEPVSEGKGPFRGWYDMEKEFLDDFYREHSEEKSKSLNETIIKYPDLGHSLGHYLNILSNYTISGAAYIFLSIMVIRQENEAILLKSFE